MAEPVYPKLEEEGSKPIGFEGISEPEGGQKSYQVQFSPTADEEDASKPVSETRTFGADEGAKEPSGSEEIKLLERRSPSAEERRMQEQTVFFEDGQRRIDFCVTYQENVGSEKKSFIRKVFKKKKTTAEGEEVEDDDDDEDSQARKDKRKNKRDAFLDSCKEAGLDLELQDCSESPDRKTYYIKIHGTHTALLKGAEDLLLRMPIEKNTLKKSSWREWFFDKIKVKDPFEPDIPEGLEIESYFTAPFSYEHRDSFLDWQNEETFFSTAQRSAIVWHIMQNARYGEDDDQVGILRLLANKSLTSSFPLHESSYTINKDEEITTDRQLLYYRWSFWKNWYKSQPVNHIRRYFGEKIGIYFTWLGFYTTWLLPTSIIGIIVMLYGLSTIPNAGNQPAEDICNDGNRTSFYMCPVCDGRCDFWYLTDTCGFAHVALLFDNGATVFFAIIMAFWGVLFLEFWKRRQFYLQYDWDMLGYEDAEERARPEFEQRIKKYIRLAKTDKAKEKFYIYNPVLERKEYIQPAHWFLPKAVTGFSILISMVLVVLAIVFMVLLYRLAVAGAIYVLVSGVEGGPSVGDIVVSITGAAIQLVAILVMNRVYEYLATWLNNWELHRTPTEYEDSFISKMYLFQFVNFYSSLFYVAFFKGNFTGYPGGYQRIGGLRLDECSSYGCLLELTIQLAIIMVGKQILNNCQELALPYVKRLFNWLKHKEETEEDIYARWEKDYDLIPLSDHGLFYEYLELIIQYGFVTIFVAAFPLAPFFALLNNWVEIRLDAHKFIAVFRRAVPERAQDIGAWFTILNIISQLSVVTNAFLIAVTAQFIPFEVYIRGGWSSDYRDFHNISSAPRLTGYVEWSLSNFSVNELVDGRAFPAFTAQELPFYVDGEEQDDLLYLPFIDFDCLIANTSGNVDFSNRTIDGYPIVTFTEVQYRAFYENITTRGLIFRNAATDESPDEGSEGLCFNTPSRGDTMCSFRGLVDEGGDRPLRYWQSWASRLGFVIVFEHFIFAISAFLAWLVPDVPQSVKNEIQREKLLAYEAIHARQKEGKDIRKGGSLSPPPSGVEGEP